jgi:hypothetical protein
LSFFSASVYGSGQWFRIGFWLESDDAGQGFLSA